MNALSQLARCFHEFRGGHNYGGCAHTELPLRGFTLLELLIAIGVTGLLATLLVSAIGKTKGRVRAVQCGAQLKSIGLLVAIYAEENRGRLPEFLGPARKEPTINGLSAVLNVSDARVWICPADKRSSRLPMEPSYAWNFHLSGHLLHGLSADVSARGGGVESFLFRDRDAWHGYRNALLLSGSIARQ